MARFDTKKQLIMTDIVRYILLLLAAAAVAAVAGCSAKKSARPIVTVSIDPQKWLLDSIVGDRAEVKSLLPGDANPENFDPPLATLRDASRSLLYMKMGHLPWEDALGERLLEGNRTMKIVDTSEGIDLITDGGHAHLHNDADGDHHDHSGADPHTWTSVRNARVIASNMVNALVEADPVNADYYRRRHADLDRNLARLDSAMSARLAPLWGQQFLVWHPSLSYFARDYGLIQIALSSGGKELSLPGLMERIAAVPDSAGQLVMFIQPQMDESGRSDAIARATGARKAVFNPMAADWDRTMVQLVDELTR